MSGGPQAGLWSLALGGSLALHGLIGTALYAMPRSDSAKPPPTEITMAMPDAGSVSTLAPAVVAPVALDQAAPVAVSPTEAIAPVAAAAAVAAPVEQVAAVAEVQPADVAARPDEPEQAEPVEESVASLSPQDAEASAPVADQAALPAVSEQAAAAATPDSVPSVGATAETLSAITPQDAESLTPQASESVAPADDSVEPSLEAARDAVAALTVEDATSVAVGEADPVAPDAGAASVAPLGETAAAVAPIAPEIAPSQPAEAIKPAPQTAQAPDVVDTQDVAASPTIVEAAPEPNIVRVVPDSATTPSTTVVQTAPSVPALPIAPVPDDAAAEPGPVALAPVGAGAPASPPAGNAGGSSGAGEQVAMLVPKPQPGNQQPATGPVELAKFLKGYEDAGDCLLALPRGNGVEALSATPDSARALEADYRKRAGRAVEAEVQTVTKAQCGTLSFSRSLAQYPNYPIRLELDRRTIASGDVLSGRVTNLLKRNLYLFVVDDEGKAKLIEAISGATTTKVPFKEPLTLTSGPVKTVQLLVAIASDDPLTSVITKPGVNAETFFAGLADEIRSKNRRIHFGITSFVVR